MTPTLLAMQRHFQHIDYVVLAGYLAVLVGIGWYFSRREKSTDDFFLGGRRIPWWAAGLSIFGTALSAITYVSIPGNAFQGNWVMVIAQISPIVLVPIVAAVYIPFYRRLNVTTPYEYLQKRFNTPVRLLASAQWVLFQFGRMSIILYIPSLALSAATGLNVYACILIMGVLSTLYTVLGGLEAVIWTDALQVVILMGGAVASLCFVAAGVEGGFAGIVAEGVAGEKFHMLNFTWDVAAPAVWVIAIGAAVSNFAVYTTDQALVQRYMSTRTLRESKAALWTSALGSIPTGLLFFFLGTALWVFYRQHPALLPEDMAGDRVFPLFIVQQLPPGLSGLIIAGIFAAAMSSVDSGVNSISAAVTTDFVRRFRPEAGERFFLRLARVLAVVIGAIGTSIALVLATWDIQSLYGFFLMVLGLFTGGLAGLFVLGIFTRRAGAWGSLVGAAVSATVMAVARWRPQWVPVHELLYGVLSLAICVGVGYVASLILPAAGKSLAGLTVFTAGEEVARS
ncbi:MAG: sodium:solute symporter [Phycisphaerae bacterium]